MTPADQYLRFGCPRCMAKLRARQSQAGTKQRCLRCYHAFTVPTPQQLAAMGDRTQEYPILEGEYEPRNAAVRASESAGVADCPVCRTRNVVGEDQIGQELACPDCGTMVLVSRRVERPRVDEAAALARLDAFYDALPEGAVRADVVHIPVMCPVCETLMHGTVDMVGKQIVCPDCNASVVVPPLAEVAAPVAHPVDDVYDLTEPVAASSPVPGPQPRPLILVVCSLCHCRMHVEPDQVGELITCPDCGTPAVVPRPAEARKRQAPEAPAGEYEVGDPVERTAPAPEADVRQLRIAPDDPLAAEKPNAYITGYSKPPPPERPFATGIVSFLWDPGTWPRLLILTIVSFIALPLILMALTMMADPIGVGWASSAPPVFLSMVLLAFGILGGAGWGLVASAYLLAILQDTAEGNPSVQDWPEPPITDWVVEFFFLFNSLAASVGCGVVIVQVFGFVGPIIWLAVPLCVFFLFPFFLLSMLEGNSCVMPVSFTVLGSVFSAWRAWALFYLETVLLAGAHVFLFAVAVRFLGSWGLLPMGILTAPVLMVYFRILGRLGWCCAEATREGKEPAITGSGRRRSGR